jgi:hypothetical protein
MVSKTQMEPSSLRIYCTKIRKKWTKGKNVTAPQVRGVHFYRNFSIKQFIAYFQTPQKIFKYYFVSFKVTKWFVKLKMVISEFFKLLNLNKKIKKNYMHWWNRTSQNEKKWKKNKFYNKKKLVFYSVFF